MNNVNTLKCCCGLIVEETKCFMHNMYELQMVGKRFAVNYWIYSQLKLFGNVEIPKKLENAYVLLHTHTHQIKSIKILKRSYKLSSIGYGLLILFRWNIEGEFYSKKTFLAYWNLKYRVQTVSFKIISMNIRSGMFTVHYYYPFDATSILENELQLSKYLCYRCT